VDGSNPMPDPAPSDDLPGDPPAPPPAGGADAPRVEEWETRFTYLYSDFENFRRRTERERETLRIRSEAEVLREVLPIVEAAEKAVEAVQELPRRDPVRRGVELLQQTIASFLETHGVHPVATAGQPFRAEEHEAVAEAPPSAKAPEGAVAEVVQQGYAFSGGLLRPAKVVVARNPPDPAPARSDRPTAPGGPDAPETPP
jgi:molecular chaperone GrpE